MNTGRGTSTPYYDRNSYTVDHQGQDAELRERNRDHMIRSTERDEWCKAVDEFIGDKRSGRERSPQRDMRDFRERYWRDRKYDSRGNRGHDYKGGLPRDVDRSSLNSAELREIEFIENERSRDRQKNYSNLRWYESCWSSESSGNRRFSRGDYRRWSDTSRDQRSTDRTDGRKIDDRSSKDSTHSNEDGYDSSEEPLEPDDKSRLRDSGNTNDFDKIWYKDQVPNRTIILRGLAHHITENDIRQDAINCKLIPKDIRLLRRRDNGASRGFAFVEFLTTAEATSWIEMKKGEIILKDHYRSTMQYSLQKTDNIREIQVSDWYCTKCSGYNFKRRETCHKCNGSRSDGEMIEGYEVVCTVPTNTVLLRGLDALTTGETVLQSIKHLTSFPIKRVNIGRDSVTKTSRGMCHLEMNSVVEAIHLHNALLLANPTIDEKQPIVSYCKMPRAVPGSTANTTATSSSLASAAIAAAQWSQQNTTSSSSSNKETVAASIVTQYTLDDVPKLAEYSANLYAKTKLEKATYLIYYRDYYTKAISQGEQISLPSSASLIANPSSAQTVIEPEPADGQWLKTSKCIKWVKIGGQQPSEVKPSGSTVTPLSEPPDGLGEQTYPEPDVNSYKYRISSGYYYDPYTTLYYDANSQYYYNHKIQKFLYWDSEKKTFLLAPTSAASTTEQGAGNQMQQAENDQKQKEEETKMVKEEETKMVKEEETKMVKEEKTKKGKDKEKQAEKDKLKAAKRIAKDMEKWAKSLNQKKEIARQNLTAGQNVKPAQASLPALKAQGAADIGFAVLELKDVLVPNIMNVNSNLGVNVPDKSLVAAYGQGSDSEDDNDITQDEKKLMDWSKLACLLCKRQFPSREVLIKHQQLSDLHKQNLEQWYKSRGLDMADVHREQYRDRAKERRLKFGEPDQPQPNRLKDNYVKARQATINYEEPTKMGLGSDNLGNKLLQKMGWQEGMGLGKKNQGRTSIIEAERRSATAGLGIKSRGVVPGPGETYKDCVKKMMKIRYQEIEEKS